MITTVKVPNRFAIAMEVAPLVRLGIITDAEGHALVERRYKIKAAELRREA